MTAKRTPATKKKPKHYTAAQNRQFRRWARQHPFPKHPAKHKPGASASSVKRYPANNSGAAGKGGPLASGSVRRSAAGLAISDAWIIGGNDEVPSCVATAVANSLLAVTGIRISDQDVLELHELAGGGDGVSISDTLAALESHGIGGRKPAGCVPVEALFAGAIVGMSDGVNDHAVTSTRQGDLISWGAPLDAELAEGWQLDGEIWYIDWTTRS